MRHISRQHSIFKLFLEYVSHIISLPRFFAGTALETLFYVHVIVFRKTQGGLGRPNYRRFALQASQTIFE